MLSCLPVAALAQAAKPVDIAIVVSLDRSESIDAEEAKAQIDGLVYTLRHSRFRDTVAVGWYGSIALSVITWSSFGRYEVILPWSRIADRGDAAGAAKILELDYARQIFARHGSQTDLAFAIEIGMNQLEDLGLRRSGSWSLIINRAQDVGKRASRDCDLGRHLCRVIFKMLSQERPYRIDP